jgi:hypothetical protein
MISEEKEAWKGRYELLRRQALDSNGAGARDRWGLSLLIGQGVAGWMRAWQDPASCAESTHVEKTATASGLPGSWQQEVTRLLANMALSHCQDLRSVNR